MHGISLRKVSLMNLALPLVGVSVVLFACLYYRVWPLACVLLVEQAVIWYALTDVFLDASAEDP